MFKININGIVQGVGFRPFIFRLASEMNIKGYVLNSDSGVEIEAVSSEKNLFLFIERIKKEKPEASQINKLTFEEFPDKNYKKFFIKESGSSGNSMTFISPDIALCSDCLEEFKERKNFRYNYPFINCTNCGPRYSIIEDIPYDRPFTSMKKFSMCKKCYEEYSDPLNRRFHAQPVACSECGPEFTLYDKEFNEVKSHPIEKSVELLKSGKIIAIKGIGGFHICCNGEDEEAVSRLRKRKSRPHKPFAIMVEEKNLSEIVQYNEEEFNLLKSSIAPILILKKKGNYLKNISPDNPNIGVFLPYAPHHYQLFDDELKFLVMTSGNRSGEPIAKKKEKLLEICDYFLDHNREIINRCDDSIIIPGQKWNKIVRRSRGFVPRSITLPFNNIETLGVGGEMKLTFSLLKEDSLFVSPYIGNSNNYEVENFYKETLYRYKKWFRIEPEIIASDLNPDFFTSRYAKESNLELFKVQHHHAHIVSVMAEHGLRGKVIGISCDGTGLGPDGTIWGGEIMVADYLSFERIFHLENMPLPSGDISIRNPIRLAYAYLLEIGIEMEKNKDINQFERNIISKQVKNGFNLFKTSSMGRLFDVVSAICNLVARSSFEAEAAMRLEFTAGNRIGNNFYPYRINGENIEIREMLYEIYDETLKGVSIEEISRKFHKTIVEFLVEGVELTEERYGIKNIILSGGVMLNKILSGYLLEKLEEKGYRVYFNKNLSPGDESISVGQAVVASYRKKNGLLSEY